MHTCLALGKCSVQVRKKRGCQWLPRTLWLGKEETERGTRFQRSPKSTTSSGGELLGPSEVCWVCLERRRKSVLLVVFTP